jgi:uncharacterized protein YcbK (DUF882 family)
MSQRNAGAEAPGGIVSRRGFLKIGMMTAASAMVPGAAMAALKVLPRKPRELSFFNLHTGESLKTVYYENGKYVPEALARINYILRDFRQNEIKPIDPDLLDLLVGIHGRLEVSAPFDVISGYRSPKTNAMLHARSEGVAAHSLHLDGKAIDIRVPGRDLSTLHKVAVSMLGGGVGYYPKSNFVHVDTGRVRYW